MQCKLALCGVVRPGLGIQLNVEKANHVFFSWRRRIHIHGLFRICESLSILLFLTTFFTISANGQISDSLYEGLPRELRPARKQKNTIQEKQTILSFTEFNGYEHYTPELLSIGHSLVQQAKSLKNDLVLRDVLYAVAHCFQHIDTDASIFYFKMLLPIAERYNNNYHSWLLTAYLSLGGLYFYKEKYDSSVIALNEGLKWADKRQDSGEIAGAYNIYSIIYARFKMYDSSIKYSKKVMELYTKEEINTKSYIQNLLNLASHEIGAYEASRKNYYRDTALSIVNRVMDLKSEQALWYQACYYFLGYIDYLEGHYTSAIEKFNLSMSPAYNDSSAFMNNYAYTVPFYKAISLLKIGQYQEGSTQLKAILSGGKPIVRHQQLAYQALSDGAEAIGDFKTALLYFKRSRQYADSLNLLGLQGKVFETQIKYSVAKKEITIANLQQKNQHQRNSRNMILLTATLLFLLLFFLFVLWYQRNKRQQYLRVAERNRLSQELNSLEQEIKIQELQQEQEKNEIVMSQRRQISQNMHDEISNSIAAFRYLVGDLKKNARHDETKIILREIEDELQAIYLQSREFSHRLFNEKLLQGYKVTDLLTSLALRFSGEEKLQIRVEADQQKIEKILNPNQHNELYYVIKEAVVNSMKHAMATIILIRISIENSSLEFEVSDDGMFHKASGGGMGISSMQQRIQSLRGELKVISSGKGTIVSGSFPL